MRLVNFFIILEAPKLERILNQALVAFPSYLVLDSLLNKADALKHVGNVIDSTFLHLEESWGIVEVNLLSWRILYKLYESFCKFTETVIDSILLYSYDMAAGKIGLKDCSASIPLNLHALHIMIWIWWEASNRHIRGLCKWLVLKHWHIDAIDDWILNYTTDGILSLQIRINLERDNLLSLWFPRTADFTWSFSRSSSDLSHNTWLSNRCARI